jgi:hypothetical protein
MFHSIYVAYIIVEQTKEDSDLSRVNGVPHCMESTGGYGKYKTACICCL